MSHILLYKVEENLSQAFVTDIYTKQLLRKSNANSVNEKFKHCKKKNIINNYSFLMRFFLVRHTPDISRHDLTPRFPFPINTYVLPKKPFHPKPLSTRLLQNLMDFSRIFGQTPAPPALTLIFMARPPVLHSGMQPNTQVH